MAEDRNTLLGRLYQQEQEINRLKKELSNHEEQTKKINNGHGSYKLKEDHDTEGLTHGKGESYNEAIEHYRRISNHEPGNAKAHCNLGVALHKLKNIDEAIKHYKIAINLEPSYSIAYDNLGSAYTDL